MLYIMLSAILAVNNGSKGCEWVRDLIVHIFGFTVLKVLLSVSY